MKRALIKFRKGRISSYNRFDNTYTLLVLFDVNDKTNKFEKRYNIKDSPEKILREMTEDIKEDAKKKLSGEDNDNSILSGHVAIDMDELENFENKFTIFIKRFYDGALGFRRDKKAEGYINRLHSLKDDFEECF